METAETRKTHSQFKHTLPEWVWEFHGHHCPFMPIGWRMGLAALERLGIEREKDHGLFVFSEMGEGHPQTCMMDGLQAATGCTYGKNLLTRLYYGKVAAVVYHPGRGALRLALKPEIQDEMGKFEFFVYRKKGIEPSEIPEAVSNEVINFILSKEDEELFTIKEMPNFQYKPTPGSFNRVKCSSCGEYVFERYARLKDGQVLCIPCSNYEKNLAKKVEL
ncbi:MAG: FmdE family protein [Firmicutes bacterium]|nr:FmdE family protein [Bacillota bacterium]MCL5039540.1 FmdE family protein [Bacillota bacterium]